MKVTEEGDEIIITDERGRALVPSLFLCLAGLPFLAQWFGWITMESRVSGALSVVGILVGAVGIGVLALSVWQFETVETVIDLRRRLAQFSRTTLFGTATHTVDLATIERPWIEDGTVSLICFDGSRLPITVNTHTEPTSIELLASVLARVLQTNVQ